MKKTLRKDAILVAGIAILIASIAIVLTVLGVGTFLCVDAMSGGAICVAALVAWVSTVAIFS